jgi:hypothetical protein
LGGRSSGHFAIEGKNAAVARAFYCRLGSVPLDDAAEMSANGIKGEELVVLTDDQGGSAGKAADYR